MIGRGRRSAAPEPDQELSSGNKIESMGVGAVGGQKCRRVVSRSLSGETARIWRGEGGRRRNWQGGCLSDAAGLGLLPPSVIDTPGWSPVLVTVYCHLENGRF